ncbi:hypothetical protein [Aeromonas hydrophila]|uniref:hypothetical protein n=1 Tax=Aeromonas hydrophila TaxID=644 RepID=UPI00044E1280|nr:hypothetical protein [Aeromonas hydrophila]EZH78021.1 hypothetical protein AT59_23010 [Aeromonas hydrophila AD9]
MQIILLGSGPHHDIAVSGNLITIGGMTVDCQAEQHQEQTTISLYQTDNGISTSGPGAFVATVVIPPQQWPATIEQQSEDQPAATMPLPLNPDTVTLTLWPK